MLAYSTVSQLGYMFLGAGRRRRWRGITAGMFHLFTHAFFKALLFLGAGSVMHAMGGVIDMRRFGGLRQLMPMTHWTFLFGCLALAGVVPFAGFWSKDAILGAPSHETRHSGTCRYSMSLYWVGTVHGLPDGVLHVPRVLPDVLRRGARFRTKRGITPTSRRRHDGAAGDSGDLLAGGGRLLRADRTALPTSLARRRRWPIAPLTATTRMPRNRIMHIDSCGVVQHR